MHIASAGVTFGTVLATRQAGGFVLRESRYPPGLQLPEHHHDVPYFCFIVRGCVRERGRPGESSFESGSLHFHHGGDRHSGEIGALGMTAWSVTPVGRTALRLDARATWSAAEPPTIAALAARAYREFRTLDTAADLALEALCLEITVEHLRAARGVPASEPGWLPDARDYMHAHFDQRVALAEVAAAAGVHPAHLARTFRRHLGCSPGTYLRRLRVERARRALATGTEPIADIALAAGFSSQAHFTRVFHRLVGLPPAAYRRRHGARRS